MQQRIALVTGARTGIGRATAEQLAARGCHVLAAMRAAEPMSGLEIIILDVNDTAAINALAQSIGERFGRLDILVGNAGVLGERGPLAQSDPKLFEDVMAVNLNANYHLIRAFDPLIRKAPAGRAVFVSSGAAFAPHGHWGAYGVSKAALNMLVETWARELEDSPARANLLRPGAIRTVMRAQAFPEEDPMTLPPPEDIARLIADMCAEDFMKNGEMIRFVASKREAV